MHGQRTINPTRQGHGPRIHCPVTSDLLLPPPVPAGTPAGEAAR